MEELNIIWGSERVKEPTPSISPKILSYEKKERKKAKLSQSTCLFFNVSNTTTSRDVKALLFCYNPKKISIKKSKNNSSAYYATAELPNMAMALHAIKTFRHTDQKRVIGYDRPLQLSLLRSRAQNKKMRYSKMKGTSRAE